MAVIGSEIKERARVEMLTCFSTPGSKAALVKSLQDLIGDKNSGILVILSSNPVNHQTVGEILDSAVGCQILTHYLSSREGKKVLQDALGDKCDKEHIVAFKDNNDDSDQPQKYAEITRPQ